MEQVEKTLILVHLPLQLDLLRMVEVVHSLGEDKEPIHLNHLFIRVLLQDLIHSKVKDYLVDLVAELVKKMQYLVVHQHKIR